ncbi:adenylyltransferase/cytidyltransferase family protein [Xanthomonas phage BUDD]|nr:adenylyltransferase/cytidyltransferase family protein [Xanthomonas phage BUDD]
MANFDLFFGRFQPVHNGHLAVLERMNNPVVVIVKGKVASQDKEKNPFDFEYQKELLQKVIPGLRVHLAETGYLPDIIKMLGDCPDTVFCGPDRIGQYKAQMERANKELDEPCLVKFVETERVTSASVVREAIRSGDRKAFKANVPRAIWDQYSTMKKRLENG